MSDEVVACEECGLPLKHPAPGSGGTWRHGTCARGEGPPKDDPLILAMQLSTARRELEEAREHLREQEHRFDEHRRQLNREFELRTRALQASHDRLLGLLSGEIAREPSPPIIVNRECKKCGAVFELPPGLASPATPKEPSR